MTALELAERGEQVKHHECEDCWYSCPESVEGCCDDDREGCTCHAPLIHEMAAMLRTLDTELRTRSEAALAALDILQATSDWSQIRVIREALT